MQSNINSDKRTSDVSSYPCIFYRGMWTPTINAGVLWKPYVLAIHYFHYDFVTINKFKVKHHWGTEYPRGNFYSVGNYKWHDAVRMPYIIRPDSKPFSGRCIRHKDFNEDDEKMQFIYIGYAAFKYLMQYPKRALTLQYKVPKGTAPINNKRNPLDERPTNFYKLSDDEPFITIIE